MVIAMWGARVYAALGGASSVAEAGWAGSSADMMAGWAIKNKRGASVNGGKAFIELRTGSCGERRLSHGPAESRVG